ncbi:MAG: ribosome biogenesis GTPase Der [Bacteroidota bacterium]
MGNVVAIIGRPNVGKSTLFNRLTETRQAIVDEMSGVTRDRHYGKVNWIGKDFSLIDTGGYIQGSDDVFEEEIRKQVKIAINEADLLLFMVDVKEGATPLDEEVANILRRCKKEVLLVANKADNGARSAQAGEFYSLGLGEVYPISSVNGSGTGELLDKIIESLNFDDVVEVDEDVPKVSIIGKPNVGKSSLINSLIGEDRNIVTSIAGTTRDTLHVRYKLFGNDVILVDTAGIRKKAKVNEDIEFYSVMRSIKAIEGSDVCIIVVDATLGMEAQDMSIFGMIEKNKKGVVIFVNKWDLVEKSTNTMKEFEELIKERLAPFTDVPVVFGSALNKQRLIKLLEVVKQVYENKTKKIGTSELNNFFQPLMEAYPPPSQKGKYIQIKYVTQLPTKTPSFAFFCNLPQYVQASYARFLENKLREKYDFTGIPVQIFFRKK